MYQANDAPQARIPPRNRANRALCNGADRITLRAIAPQAPAGRGETGVLLPRRVLMGPAFSSLEGELTGRVTRPSGQESNGPAPPGARYSKRISPPPPPESGPAILLGVDTVPSWPAPQVHATGTDVQSLAVAVGHMPGRANFRRLMFR